MDAVTKTYEAVKVVGTSTVALLVAVSAAIATFANDIAEVVPEGQQGAVAWILRVAVGLASAAEIVRRHTPVHPDQRGITGPAVVVKSAP